MKVNYAAETAETVLHHRCSAETALRQAPNTGRQHALAPLGSASDSNVSEAIGLDDAGTARDLDRCAGGRLIARPGLLHLAVITMVRSRSADSIGWTPSRARVHGSSQVRPLGSSATTSWVLGAAEGSKPSESFVISTTVRSWAQAQVWLCRCGVTCQRTPQTANRAHVRCLRAERSAQTPS